MSVEPCHVRDSIREIDDGSWLIGNKILLCRQDSPSSGPSWSDGTGSFYVISDAPYPPPPSKPLPATSDFEIVYDAGDCSAVWKIGDAFCKVKEILVPGATREHVTLDYLHKRPLSFAIPDVLYHTEYDGRTCLILSRVPGQTLTDAWPEMDETMKQHYVSRVANICKELATWHADSIMGVDGQHLGDGFLTRRGPSGKDFSPQGLLNGSKDLGMDCSTFYFYHCDLGPVNIIANLEDGSIGIIDWETAGFVPKEWIRTKVRISSGMDLESIGQENRHEWRGRLQRQLEKEGFPDVAEQWMIWRKKDKA